MIDKKQDFAVAERRNRVLKKSLRDLVRAVEGFLEGVDLVMKQPSSVERGRKIGTLCSDLELAKDFAERFGLGKLAAKKPARSNIPRLKKRPAALGSVE